MNTLDRIVSRLALPSVVLILLVVPAWAWWYERVYLPSTYPKDAKVFTIWWNGDQGMTLNRVTAYNYWLKGLDKLDEIKVERGDRVFLRLISSDVYHGFSLPAFGINEVLVKPGELSEVEFIADKVGTFPFYCTITCGVAHAGMRAKLTVVEQLGVPVARAERERPGPLR
jgi:heme/copper-type cytochrome/quinol oxidase subunit 2